MEKKRLWMKAGPDLSVINVVQNGGETRATLSLCSMMARAAAAVAAAAAPYT